MYLRHVCDVLNGQTARCRPDSPLPLSPSFSLPPSARALYAMPGMDIKQGLSAVAAVTLGKDMTFRDYAQGAFRMRGIGKGQKVQVWCGALVGSRFRCCCVWYREKDFGPWQRQ